MHGSNASTVVSDYWKVTKSNVIFTKTAPMQGTTYLSSKALADAGVNPELFMGYNTIAGVSGNYPKDPNFASFIGLNQTGANFSNTKLQGFNNTTYKGAFGNIDWTDVWSDFNPQNKAY